MNVMPITDKTPACFGVVCPEHHRCSRYAMVESTPIDQTIATCSTGGDDRPLFLAVEKEPTT